MGLFYAMLDSNNSIIGEFSSPQLTGTPGYTVLDDSDPRVIAYLDPLPTIRRQKLAEIDAAAGNARAKYITVIAGQEMTYLEKVKQAQAFQADPSPTQTAYPMIYGEVGITAADAAGVAAVILQNYAAWQQLGAAIERQRLTAKKAISEANDEAAVASAMGAITWP